MWKSRSPTPYRRTYRRYAGRKRRFPLYRRPSYRVMPYTRLRPRYPAFSLGNRPELKYWDQVITGLTPLAGAGIKAYMPSITQGSAPTTRIGTQIIIKSIWLKLYGYSQSATTANLNRYCIIVDRQANALSPLEAELWASGSGIDVPRFKNLDNRKRFRFLADRTFHSPKAAADNDGFIISKYIRFRRGITVQYNVGNSGNYTDCTTNSLWFAIYTDAASASNSCMMDVLWRIRFSDL